MIGLKAEFTGANEHFQPNFQRCMIKRSSFKPDFYQPRVSFRKGIVSLRWACNDA